MSNEIQNLAPKEIWINFANLNAVPRPSKKEERVIQFMKDFGASLGLTTEEDEVGNVLIRKPATSGMENRKTVVLQSHLDMVHQKNNGTVFDFDTQGIKMYVDDDWVRADGTTLGADNGLGVATIMALLESTEIPHPALEALFTIDEETGMTGAMELQSDWLTGDILLNLDTEDDDEIGIGCAGGIDVTGLRNYTEVPTPDHVVAFTITVNGLKGGHSGMDIHKGLGNANKIMNRLLFDGFENFGLRISNIRGGSLRNAIPRESVATLVIDKVHEPVFLHEIGLLAQVIKKELAIVDPEMEVIVTPTKIPDTVMELGIQEGILKALYALHNGVYAMSAAIPDLVETSNNIAKVAVDNGKVTIECLTRSSIDSAKVDLVNSLRATFELMGMEVTTGGVYPGWAPNSDSPILKVLEEQYLKLNGNKAHVAACHAGLECGIIAEHYPAMDMISFGPTIKGAHSPDECVSISSVQKYWKFVKAILANIPLKS